MVVAVDRPVPSTAVGWFASLRLRERLLLLVALAGLPGMAVAFYLAASWLENETTQIEVSVERLAKLAASRQDTVIENARLVLVGVAQRIRDEALNVENCREYLSGWLDLVPVLMSLSLYDRDGGRICATDDAELTADVADKDWFGEVRQGDGFVLGGYNFGESGRPLLVAAYPLLFEQGGFRGAVGLGIDLRWLDFLSQTIDLPEDATVTAITEDGDILVHAAEGPTEGKNVGKLPSQGALNEMAAMTSGTLRAANQAGSPRVYGVQRTQSGEVVVAVGHTPYLDYARYWDAMLNTLMAPMIVLALALIAAGYGAEALVARYVRSLTRTAETIAGGDASVRSEVPYSLYEIGQLAQALDRMAAALGDDNQKLGSLVEQRETLIRELNHRVKNNVQIVLSMMRGAGADASDPKVQERIAALSGRIEALAQIHELLYQRYDTEVPALASYVQELSTLLGEFYEEEVGPARVSGAVDDIKLSIGQCISFGLILNELVANAHKHAFNDEDRGKIGVEVVGEQADAGHDVHLIVSDDGKGLPESFSLDEATSTGSRLIRGLTQQLRGEIWVERLQRGTAIHVRFPSAE